MNAKRIAMVIGNSHYSDGDISGVEDAKAMADCLRGVGFAVPPELVVLDGTLEKIGKALITFKTEMAGADAVVFYYSGHGFQLQQLNFLLPTDGSISPTGAVGVDAIIQELVAAPDAVKFVILDACRDQKNLSPDVLKGLANPGPAVPGVIQCFAASPGQPAPSGSADGLSPYTEALLKYIPQAGIGLNELFAKAHSDVQLKQEPIIVAAEVPKGFFFRAPIPVHVEISGGKSDLLVFLRSELILDTDQPITTDLLLNAGDNKLAFLVSSGRNFRNNHDWDITEGWSYKVVLTLPNGNAVTFEGSQDRPFKNGPLFGKVFQVAEVNLHVDEKTAELTPVGLDDDIANRDAPFFAKDQDTLFETTIASLNLSPDDVLGDAVDLGVAGAILKPFLVELLKSGTILGQKIADPATMSVLVMGNKALKGLAVACMGNRDDRIRDLKASIAAAFQRKPTPFDIFDQGLIACMRARAEAESSPLKPDDIRIWTALHDNGPAPQPPEVPAANAVEANPVMAPQG